MITPSWPHMSASTVPTHPPHWGGHGVEGGWGHEPQKLGVQQKKVETTQDTLTHTLFFKMAKTSMLGRSALRKCTAESHTRDKWAARADETRVQGE